MAAVYGPGPVIAATNGPPGPVMAAISGPLSGGTSYSSHGWSRGTSYGNMDGPRPITAGPIPSTAAVTDPGPSAAGRNWSPTFTRVDVRSQVLAIRRQFF